MVISELHLLLHWGCLPRYPLPISCLTYKEGSECDTVIRRRITFLSDESRFAIVKKARPFGVSPDICFLNAGASFCFLFLSVLSSTRMSIAEEPHGPVV